MKELTKAILFFIVTMTLCFTYILFKNHWSMLFNGVHLQLF